MVSPRAVASAPRIPRPRSARTATARRKVRASRARHAGVVRVAVGLAAILAFLMGYVVLTASLTGLSYAVAKAQVTREALVDETMRLDDRISALRSDDRLSGLAARLGMREPQRFAVVHLEVPSVAQAHTRFAVLSSLAGLFAPAIARRP